MSVHKAATAIMCAASLGIVAGPAGVASAHAKPHRSHHTRRQVHRAHRAHSVSFTAQVVRSSVRGLVVRTARGRLLTFTAAQVKPGHMPRRHRTRAARAHALFHADDLQLTTGNVVVNLLGLQPGVTIQIAETTDANGNVTITITLPGPMGQQTASGVVSEVDSDALTLRAGDGTGLRLHVSGGTLSNLNLHPCDVVSVTYHQDAGILVADSVNSNGASTTGDCAPSYDATGTITQVSAGAITISTDQGPRAFGVDPSSGLTDGYQAGDLVDISYTINPDGSLAASDVQFVEQETAGTVTSVTTSAAGGSLSITDASTGQPEAFNADPAHGVQINARAFNGISVGDSVDITYHQSGGGLVADTVSEQ